MTDLNLSEAGNIRNFYFSSDYTKEAKHRGLTCCVNSSSSSSSSSSYSISTTKKKKSTGFSLFGNRRAWLIDSPSDYRKIISNSQYLINQAIEICKAIASNSFHQAKRGVVNTQKMKSYCKPNYQNDYDCSWANTGAGFAGGFMQALGDDLNSTQAGKNAYRSQMRACMAQNGYGLK